jgi:NAD(P)H-flavin reductase
MSKAFHDQLEKSFILDGPHGKGLELKATSQGTHVIFAGGTGILPFLDLFDYLLRKSVNKIILQNFGEEKAF